MGRLLIVEPRAALHTVELLIVAALIVELLTTRVGHNSHLSPWFYGNTSGQAPSAPPADCAIALVPRPRKRWGPGHEQGDFFQLQNFSIMSTTSRTFRLTLTSALCVGLGLGLNLGLCAVALAQSSTPNPTASPTAATTPAPAAANGPNMQGMVTTPSNPVIEAAAKEPGAALAPSGYVYRSLKDGTGASPTAVDRVTVHYRGTLPEGKEFDSSYKRGEPATFPLSGVIRCWTEGVQRMKLGGKAKLTCPGNLAYGQRGAGPDIGPNATLVFEVELLGIAGR